VTEDEVRRVEASGWVDAVRRARDGGHPWFDWLAAVDEVGRGDHLRVVVRLAHAPDTAGVRLEVLVARAHPVLPTLLGVVPGASWHEREAHDFFGLVFTGGDDRPLMLREAFGGHPLRRDAVLGARVVRPWPGAREPGEAATAGRRRMVPAGVPDPEVWGERAGDPATPDEVAASLAGGRLRRRR